MTSKISAQLPCPLCLDWLFEEPEDLLMHIKEDHKEQVEQLVKIFKLAKGIADVIIARRAAESTDGFPISGRDRTDSTLPANACLAPTNTDSARAPRHPNSPEQGAICFHTEPSQHRSREITAASGAGAAYEVDPFWKEQREAYYNENYIRVPYKDFPISSIRYFTKIELDADAQEVRIPKRLAMKQDLGIPFIKFFKL